MEYVKTINAINVYYNLDSTYIILPLIGSILILIGIVVQIMVLSDKFDDEFFQSLVIILMVFGVN